MLRNSVRRPQLIRPRHAVFFLKPFRLRTTAAIRFRPDWESPFYLLFHTYFNPQEMWLFWGFEFRRIPNPGGDQCPAHFFPSRSTILAWLFVWWRNCQRPPPSNDELWGMRLGLTCDKNAAIWAVFHLVPLQTSSPILSPVPRGD